MMKFNSSLVRLAFLVIAVVTMELFTAEASPAMAQNRWDQVVEGQRRARPQREVRRVTRRPVVRRQRSARPERVNLLTIQLRLLRREANGQEREVSRFTSFAPGSRLRLELVSNQRGFLFILRQPTAGADAMPIFPNELANDASNEVLPNRRYVVPSGCAPGVDCWYTVPPPGGVSEVFTIIFSRDEDVIEDLYEQLTSNGRITQQMLAEAVRQSGQQTRRIDRPAGLSPNITAGPHTVWFRNFNSRASEDIIVDMSLSKGSQTASNVPTTSESSDASATEPNDTTTEVTPTTRSSTTGSITTTTPSTSTTTTTTGTSTRTRTTNTVTPRRP